MKRLGAILLVGVLASACSHRAPPADVKPAAMPATPADAYATWGKVLTAYVTDTGKIDFAQLKKDGAGDLKTFVAWVGTHGPRSQPADYPTPEAKIAYYLNSYNGLAMYNAITNKVHPKQKIRFFVLTKMRIDGQDLDLHAYENEVIRPLGEPRVHFALNCMVHGCPRLPQVPYSPDPAQLGAQLDAGAKLFFNETRNVELHADTKTVRFSSILKFYTGDFLKKAPSLIAYANSWRPADQQIPADYAVKFIPYDWTLNQK